MATEGLSELRHNAERGQARREAVSTVLSILLLFLLTWGAIEWWRDYQTPQIRSVAISNAQVVGESALCPGDTLMIRYDLRIVGEGVVIRDTSTERVSPPQTVVFSEWERYPIRGPIDQQVVIPYLVPKRIFNFATGRREPTPAGRYVRNISETSWGRGAVTDMVSIPFTLREDCNE